VLGGLAPRVQPEDPLRTLKQLASIMYELRMAAVIVVDQICQTVIPARCVSRASGGGDHAGDAVFVSAE
jgi:hypothetical protein